MSLHIVIARRYRGTAYMFGSRFESEIPIPCTQYKCNVLSVPKRDGSLRLVCDLRHINKFTKPSNLKLARADDIVESLLGYRYYSSIDHVKGYCNLPLAEDQQGWYLERCQL